MYLLIYNSTGTSLPLAASLGKAMSFCYTLRVISFLLAMLTFREMSGYELKSVIDKSVGHFYMRPALSQIYPELRRLAAHDLVKARKVVQEIRPDKRLYSLTPAGRAAVTQWLAEQS